MKKYLVVEVDWMKHYFDLSDESLWAIMQTWGKSNIKPLTTQQQLAGDEETYTVVARNHSLTFFNHNLPVEEDYDWVSVDVKMPAKDGRYRVKGITKLPPLKPSEPFEREVRFHIRKTRASFRVGDWQTVTHWKTITKSRDEK